MTTRLALRRWTGPAALAALALVLTACTQAPEAPAASAPAQATAVPSGSASAPTASAPEAPDAFVPDGDATANLPIFTSTIETVWASGNKAQGRAYIDALVAAGFADKNVMQLTPDQTTIGEAAESIMMSVRIGGQCLIGQVGPATGDPIAQVAPQLSGGLCLVGKTRPIDW